MKVSVNIKMDEQLKLDKKYIQNNFGYALEEELKEPTKDNIVLNIVYKYLYQKEHHLQ